MIMELTNRPGPLMGWKSHWKKNIYVLTRVLINKCVKVLSRTYHIRVTFQRNINRLVHNDPHKVIATFYLVHRSKNAWSLTFTNPIQIRDELLSHRSSFWTFRRMKSVYSTAVRLCRCTSVAGTLIQGLPSVVTGRHPSVSIGTRCSTCLISEIWTFEKYVPNSIPS
jgi:hypothetical protein